MPQTIQLRRDTVANWLLINPILNQGEPGFEIDTGKMKIGDGINKWKNLNYTGSTGFTGSHGLTGSPGPQGAIGPIGPSGASGSSILGAVGPRGYTGSASSANATYSPANPSHWADPAPTTVLAAIDRIAAQLYARSSQAIP